MNSGAPVSPTGRRGLGEEGAEEASTTQNPLLISAAEATIRSRASSR